MKPPTLERVVKLWFVTFLVCVILWMASLVARGATEDFREFHIPAKQSTNILGGILTTEHFDFSSYSANQLSPLIVHGVQPTQNHAKSLESVGDVLVMRFDTYATHISFDLLTDGDVTLQTIGYGVQNFTVSPQGDWLHVELVGLSASSGIAIYVPCHITNITIE